MRRLDRIEKEMGYCEVKLEKERRLRYQQLYLKADVEALDEVLGAYPAREVESRLKFNELGGYPMAEVPRILRRGDKRQKQEVRQGFLWLATYLALREEREILGNELETINHRLESYDGFESRRLRLEEQRRRTLQDLGLREASVTDSLLKSFEDTEDRWN